MTKAYKYVIIIEYILYYAKSVCMHYVVYNEGCNIHGWRLIA